MHYPNFQSYHTGIEINVIQLNDKDAGNFQSYHTGIEIYVRCCRGKNNKRLPIVPYRN